MKLRSVYAIVRHPVLHTIQLWVQTLADHYWNRRAPWAPTRTGVAMRYYRTHNHYLQHQASKFWWYQPYLKRKWQERLRMYDKRFQAWAWPGRTVLCLGARDGVEVAAFRMHGCLAIGIDLAYPKQNAYVVYGDMHDLTGQWPPAVFDVVYTNCLDHIKDMFAVSRQINTLLKPEGCWWIDTYTVGQQGGAFEVRDLPPVEETIAAIQKLGWTLYRQAEFEEGMTSLQWIRSSPK